MIIFKKPKKVSAKYATDLRC